MRLSQAVPTPASAVLVLADGTVFEGKGVGALGEAVGEVCFNTAVTGYQEILTDPSYAEQIVTFTFPHIGNVGANDEDLENASSSAATAARGAIFRAEVTSPSNYRARLDLGAWLKRRGIVAISGVDTRALTARIREKGMPHGVIAHNPEGRFDIETLTAKARDWAGLEGADLAKAVSAPVAFSATETDWRWEEGFGRHDGSGPHVVVIDFGVKRNILRLLAGAGARVSVVSDTTSFDDIMARRPDGVVLSNGPGDPAATAGRVGETVKQLIASDTPLLGICLGHQMLATALGAKTVKMSQGHHGANHPVQDLSTGKVEIVSMNHGFTVDAESLPEGVYETYRSLFDGTNCGVAVKGRRSFPISITRRRAPALRTASAFSNALSVN